MFGMIGDRLRRWLDGGPRPATAAAAAANGKSRVSKEMDGANAEWRSTGDMMPTLAGPDDAEMQADQGGQAPEANDEV